MSTPQEVVEYFFIWKSLIRIFFDQLQSFSYRFLKAEGLVSIPNRDFDELQLVTLLTLTLMI